MSPRQIKSGQLLVRHDAQLMRNGLKAAFKKWSDRITLLVGVPFLGFVLHHAIAGLDEKRYLLIGGAFGLIAGMALIGFIHGRLRYHRGEGVLAPVALDRWSGLFYGAIIMAATAIGCLCVMALVAPGGVLAFLALFPAGVVLGFLWIQLSRKITRSSRPRNLVKSLDRFTDSPWSGLAFALPVASMILIGSARAELNDLISIAAVLTAAGAIALGRIQSSKIRFMAQCGYSTRESLWLEARPLLLFGLCIIMIGALGLGVIGTVVLAAIGTGAILIQAMAVMLYRTHGKRTADVLFSLLLALVGFVWFTLPPIAPVIHGLVLWYLGRESRAARWRIA